MSNQNPKKKSGITKPKTTPKSGGATTQGSGIGGGNGTLPPTGDPTNPPKP